MSDLISRQAAIDTLKAYCDFEEVLEKLPSVQPTYPNTSNTLNALNLIDREAAIEEIARRDTTDGTVKVFSGKKVINILKELPSAQQKPLKYTGDSICLYCQTADCEGCMYEPMEGVQ